jgi:4-hydroxyphenylpyruvate dioxygenase
LLPAPPTYYQGLRERLTQAPELEWQDGELQCLIENQILMDWQPGLPESVLLQIFTSPVLPNSLFFFEFIERLGKRAQGFGERNFQALYEAVEAELERR